MYILITCCHIFSSGIGIGIHIGIGIGIGIGIDIGIGEICSMKVHLSYIMKALCKHRNQCLQDEHNVFCETFSLDRNQCKISIIMYSMKHLHWIEINVRSALKCIFWEQEMIRSDFGNSGAVLQISFM